MFQAQFHPKHAHNHLMFASCLPPAPPHPHSCEAYHACQQSSGAEFQGCVLPAGALVGLVLGSRGGDEHGSVVYVVEHVRETRLDRRRGDAPLPPYTGLVGGVTVLQTQAITCNKGSRKERCPSARLPACIRSSIATQLLVRLVALYSWHHQGRGTSG